MCVIVDYMKYFWPPFIAPRTTFSSSSKLETKTRRKKNPSLIHTAPTHLHTQQNRTILVFQYIFKLNGKGRRCCRRPCDSRCCCRRAQVLHANSSLNLLYFIVLLFSTWPYHHRYPSNILTTSSPSIDCKRRAYFRLQSFTRICFFYTKEEKKN